MIKNYLSLNTQMIHQHSIQHSNVFIGAAANIHGHIAFNKLASRKFVSYLAVLNKIGAAVLLDCETKQLFLHIPPHLYVQIICQ